MEPLRSSWSWRFSFEARALTAQFPRRAPRLCGEFLVVAPGLSVFIRGLLAVLRQTPVSSASSYQMHFDGESAGLWQNPTQPDE